MDIIKTVVISNTASNLYNDSYEKDKMPKKNFTFNVENKNKIPDNNKSSMNLNSDSTKNDNSINQNDNMHNYQEKKENLSNLPSNSKIGIDNIIMNKKKDNFKFCKFLIYKITFGIKIKEYKNYEDFRKKIISEEQLIKNHLNIYNLVKNTKSKSNFKRIYTLKDSLNNNE